MRTLAAKKRQVTLGQYLREMQQGPVQPAGADATEHWYLFGDTMHPDWLALTAGVAPPHARQDDPLATLGIGTQYSGVGWHTHGPAWATQLLGMKRWYLASPQTRPPFNVRAHPTPVQVATPLTIAARPAGPCSRAVHSGRG